MKTMDRPTRFRFWLTYPLCLLMLVACQKSVEDRLADARLQQEIGSWQKSIATLQDVLKDEPDQPEANLLLGSAQIALGQSALAIWPLEVAGRSAEFADPADLALGAAYLQLQQTDAALAAADRVLARQDPARRRSAITIRAGANIGARRWEAAIEDVDRLLADDAENPEALALMAQALLGAERIDEAEATLRRMWESPSVANTSAGARAGVSLAKLYAYQRKDMPAAESLLQEMLERYPNDPSVLSFVTDFLGQNDRPDLATKLLREALERDPGDLRIRNTLATHLASHGDEADAERLLVEATDLFGSPQTWLHLSEFHRGQERYREALEDFERALELVPGASDLLHFRHAGLLADVGELDRAEATVGEVQGSAYRETMLGRIAFLRGQYAEALAHFDEGLREWPNNAGARYLAGKAAIAQGDFDRGIEEYREALRAGLAETDAGLELALIHLKLGQPAQALASAGLLMGQGEFLRSPRAGNALVLLARASWMAGDREEAREKLDRLAGMEGFATTAILEHAGFDAETDGPAAAARRIDAGDLDLTDPVNEPALRQLCAYRVQAGQSDLAVARARAAVAARPDEPAFHDILGRVLVNVGRGNEAMASFDRVLELDPDFAPGLEGKASLLLAAGDTAGALDLYDRAAAADPENASYAYRAAQLTLGSGDVDGTIARLRGVLARDPLHAHASNDLAWLLADRGESLDQALQLATRASQLDPSASVLDTLGWVHYQRGEHRQAVAALEKAHALDDGSASIAYRLGLALVETGERERARSLFREALAGGPFPEADAARAQLSRLETEAS